MLRPLLVGLLLLSSLPAGAAAEGVIAASVRRQASVLAVRMPHEHAKSGRSQAPVVKGALIGGIAGCALGVTLAYALKDCGGCKTHYARAGFVFGASGAATGALIGAVFGKGSAEEPTSDSSRSIGR